MARACWASKGVERRGSRPKTARAPTTSAAIAPVWRMSGQSVPSMSPNKYVRQMKLGLDHREHDDAGPEHAGKDHAMTVSSLTRLFSFRKPVASAQTIAGDEGADRQRQAENEASTMPGSTAWLIASPISDQPFSTKIG